MKNAHPKLDMDTYVSTHCQFEGWTSNSRGDMKRWLPSWAESQKHQFLYIKGSQQCKPTWTL